MADVLAVLLSAGLSPTARFRRRSKIERLPLLFAALLLVGDKTDGDDGAALPVAGSAV